MTTVTATAVTLREAGLIRWRRDVIAVLDRGGLEAAACGCYRIVRDRCARLLAGDFD